MKTRKKLLTLALLCLALVGVSHPGYGATIGFKPAQSYPAGTAPASVAVGDFNGDGNLDLAVANYGDPTVNDGGNVSILLGNGDGTFQPPINITAGKGPVSIVVADFNSDTRLDLAVADIGDVVTGDPGGVSILLGNGDGTFQPAKNFAAGGNPRYLAAADFNGDHKPDLVVGASGLDQTLRVFLGNGDGTFQAPVDYPTTGTVEVADFNGDGNLDVVAGAILLGNGDGSFQAAVGYANANAKGIALGTCVGDFNGDQKVDLAVEVMVPHFLKSPSFETDVLLGNGDGTFQGPVAVAAIGGFTCSVGDFDGDGKLDLVTSSGPLAVLLGKGDGTFQPPVFLDAGGTPGPAAAADFNGDKAPDLVLPVTTVANNTISVLLNSTGAEFSITASAPSPPTVNRGQSSTSTVTLNHLNAFDNPVTLACSVQPTQSAPTCSLNANSVTFDANGNATATLNINTGAATASLVPSFLRQDSRPLQFLWLPVAGFAFMGVGVSRSSSSRRRLLGFFVGCVLFACLILQAACGGGSSSSSPTSQTYTITVTGTSGSTQHSTTVTLAVE